MSGASPSLTESPFDAKVDSAVENTRSWFCKTVLPPRHDALKALAAGLVAVLVLIIGALIGSWDSWVAWVVGIGVGIIVFALVYVVTARVDFAKKCTPMSKRWQFACGKSQPHSTGASPSESSYASSGFGSMAL